MPRHASPTVGIALAVYRPDPRYFAAQLASIQAQTLTDWVTVLTCDSPLGELRAEPLLAPFFDDPRFEWHENAVRLGVKGNFARALELARARGAKWLAFSDQDDVWYPHKLERLVGALEGKPPLAVSHADMDVLVDGATLERSAWQLEARDVSHVTPAALFVRNVVTGASMLMDAGLAARYPEVPDDAPFHDYWYAVAASHHGGVYPVHERLHAYRQHGGNVVGVRPYKGFLDGKRLDELVIDEALVYYRGTRAFVLAAARAGMPVSELDLLSFTRRRDAGVSLVVRGVAALRDPNAASGFLALAIGKVLDVTVPPVRAALERRRRARGG